MQKSTAAMNAEAKNVTTMTTAAACHNSFQVGQVTFLSSCCVSRKKFAAFCTFESSRYLESLILPVIKQAWQPARLRRGLGALRFRVGSATRSFKYDACHI